GVHGNRTGYVRDRGRSVRGDARPGALLHARATGDRRMPERRSEAAGARVLTRRVPRSPALAGIAAASDHRQSDAVVPWLRGGVEGGRAGPLTSPASRSRPRAFAGGPG